MAEAGSDTYKKTGYRAVAAVSRLKMRLNRLDALDDLLGQAVYNAKIAEENAGQAGERQQ